MRQLGNARADAISFLESTDVFDPIVDTLSAADSLTAAAPGFDPSSSSLLADTQPTDGGTPALPSSDLSNVESSVADWLSNFRPFSSSLVSIDGADDHNTNNANPFTDTDSANDNVSPFFNSSSDQPGPVNYSLETDAKVKFDAFQIEHNGESPASTPNNDHMFADGAAPGPLVNSVPGSVVASAKSIDIADATTPTTILVSEGGGVALPGGSSTTSSTTSTTTGGAQTSGLIINVTYDASVANAPAGFKADVAAAVQYFESHFSDPITININVGFGEVNGLAMNSGALGQSMYFVNPFNYSQVKGALAGDAKSAADLSSVASLPASDPTNGGTFWVTSANSKALGLSTGSSTDGFVGFSSAANLFDYDNTNGVTAGQYDFLGTVMHEISEVLGRETNDGQNFTYYPLDLFHYSSPGVRTFSGTTPGYFSVDNGQTNLANFNTNPGGDFGDLAGNTIDAANAFGTPGVVEPFSTADLTALDVVGWNTAGTTAPAPVVSVSLSVDTGSSSADKVTANPTITGTGNAGAVVTITEGTTTLGTTTANASGLWSFTPTTLPNGVHTVTASETDSAGNTGSASLTFTLDTVAPLAPTIVAFSPDSGLAGDHVTNVNTVTLTGTAEANSTVKFSEGTTVLGAVTANSSGAWSFTTAALVNGLHSVTATATDAAGNSGAPSAAFAITIDTMAPTAPVIATDVVVNTNEAALSGAAEANSVVKIFDGSVLLGSTTANGSGAWNYTTAPLATGSHSFTATATDAAGNTSVASSASAATINSTITTVIEAKGATSLVEVGTKFFLDSISTGTGPSLKYNGVDVVAGQFGSWTPIGAEQTATGYQVAWKVPGADQYSIWTTDSSGNFISTTQAMSGTTSVIESAETAFHQDLNGDGAIGVPGTVIEGQGATSLVEVGNKFFLDSIATGTGPSLKYAGADVVAGQFSNWTPIGAEQTATGYQVVWKIPGADQYSIWTTDSSGNFISTTQVMSGTTSIIESAETTFHQDFNGDGVIGVPGTVIESQGATSLVEVGTKFFLDSISTGTGPSLKYAGADVVAGQFGGWTPIATEQTTTGYEVAWKLAGVDQYSIWSTDSSGNTISNNVIGLVTGNNSALESIETSFHQDLNGDGVIGVPGTVIEAQGVTSLVEVGTNFFLDSTSSASAGPGPALKYSGAVVFAGEFGSWTPIGAEQTATGYQVAWKIPGADQYSIWTTDSSGNFISTTQAMSGTSSTIESAETAFHQDLNGDGVIGVPGTVIEAQGATSLVEVGTKFFLDSIGTGTGPSLKYAGADVVAGQFGSWAPLGTEHTATGYQVAWKVPGADQYSIWNTDNSGNFISTTQAMSGASAIIESAETAFHQDLNGDGVIGVPGTLIEAQGATSLIEVGTKFFLDSISTGTGPSLKYAGADVAAGQFGGWTPLGAEQTASGYQVAWKVPGTDQYSIWSADNNGNFVSTTQAMSGTSSIIESAETAFHQDLNGDGVIGVPGGLASTQNLSTSSASNTAAPATQPSAHLPTENSSLEALLTSDVFKFAELPAHVGSDMVLVPKSFVNLPHDVTSDSMNMSWNYTNDPGSHFVALTIPPSHPEAGTQKPDATPTWDVLFPQHHDFHL